MNIYTLDSETDPFKEGRRPQAFAWGLYDGTWFDHTWGEDCTRRMMDKLYQREPGIVYTHNLGKFDIFFILEYIDKSRPMLIIKDRIVQCYIRCAKGLHKLRDSLKILPFSLDTYQKTTIDYTKFEQEVRQDHKDEIVAYLKDDCVFLYQLCSEFINTFGPAITIGTAAMKELKKFHDIGDVFTFAEDDMIRHKYFFGARVERYQTGVHAGEWRCYDVNSMYPYVMSSLYHPIGLPSTDVSLTVNANTYFITARGYSRGAFPIRTPSGVSFPHAQDTYSVSIHEWDAANELKLFDCDEILECVNFRHSRCFVDYIRHFYGLRKKARIDGDKIHEIFYKYLLNNSYGKFAINPESFKEYMLSADTADLRWHGFTVAELIPAFNLILWEKPAEEFNYANIATGASITGAARSVLLRALNHCDSAMYCDTDSIICRNLRGVEMDDVDLGAWKLEKSGNLLAIAGRKMYALFDGSACVKYASKGVRITPEQIRAAAEGAVITYRREAPTYRLDGSVDWLTRRVRLV
jgi:hypothetical protein